MVGLVDAAGLVAALLTTAAFLPQVVATWRARSAAGLSLAMLVVFATGVALWLVYGIGTGQVPVILANGVTLVLVAVLLGLKLADRRRMPRRIHPGPNGGGAQAAAAVVAPAELR